MFIYNGQIARYHCASTAFDKVEHLLLIRGVQVIKEDSSNTSSLSSMTDIEVSVTPLKEKERKKVGYI